MRRSLRKVAILTMVMLLTATVFAGCGDSKKTPDPFETKPEPFETVTPTEPADVSPSPSATPEPSEVTPMKKPTPVGVYPDSVTKAPSKAPTAEVTEPAKATPTANPKEPTPTVTVAAAPTATATATPTAKVTATATPTAKVTGTATPTAAPTTKPVSTPTEKPVQPVKSGSLVKYKTTSFPNVSGQKARLREEEYFRPAPGRTEKKEFILSYDSRIIVLESKKCDFNETWCKVAVLLDGQVKYGYLQAAAVSYGDSKPEKPKDASLIHLSTDSADLTKHFGNDKDGDGVYVIVLDPGHGGPYSGAYHYGRSEKDLNLAVAKACKAYLEANYDNVKVYLTRTGDTVYDTVSDVDDLEGRVRFARSKGADALISMHFDAFDGRVNGAEVLIPTKATYTNRAKALSAYVLKELGSLGIKSLGPMKKYSTRSRYSYPDGGMMDGYLINRLASESGILSCIIEHAHMDNSVDKKFIDSDAKLRAIGEADAHALAAYFQLPKKGTVTPTPTVTVTVTPTPEPTPIEPEPSPKEPEPSPIEPEPSPIEPEPSPKEPEPSPVEPEPSPKEPEPSPVEPEPSPKEPEPSPVEPEPSPKEPEPSPKEPEPSPKEPEPSPVEPEPSPKEPEPSPKEPEPSPKEPEPSPKEPEPSPKEPEPSPKEPEPSPKEPEPSPAEPDPSPAEPDPSPEGDE